MRNLISYPGETLQEVMDNRNLKEIDLIRLVDMSGSYIWDVLHGYKPITELFAERLEKALGIDKSFWLNLQANYDSEMANLK